VDEEILYHLERVTQELMDEGMKRSEAERAAIRRFGDVEAYGRALRTIDGRRRRSMRGTERLDEGLRLLAQAVRHLFRAPGFTFAVVTVLALGLGANTVMFGVVDRLLLSPPRHVRDAESVRLLYLSRSLSRGETVTGRTVAFPDYADFRGVAAFQAVAALSGDDTETLGRGEGAQQVRVVGASASFFPLLGARPALGRFFAPDEDRPGVPGTAVVSQEFWERAYASDPAVLGRTLDLGTGVYTVVGVAPAGFTGTDLHPVDVWLPLEVRQALETGGTEWREHRNWWWLNVVVRLAPGVTADMAGQQATAAHRRGREESIARGDYDAGARVIAGPIIAAQGPRPSDESRVARWLAAVSALVLLIACLNVANLLLAQATRRRREVAVRVALGVSRSRLVGELLLESLLLASLGSAAALVLARVGGGVVYRALLPDVAVVGQMPMGRLLLFALVATVLAALVAGIAPALQAIREDPAIALRTGGGGGGHPASRARAALLVGQATFSVVLLVAAGLFVKSLSAARGTDLGFDARHVVVAQLEWNETLPAAERAAIYRAALEKVQALPDVRAAGLTYTVPFQSSIAISEPRIPGLDSLPRHPAGGPYVNKVGSGYFEAMGLDVVRGRAFQPTDDSDGAPPVAVVTEGMARAMWPAGDALGACMYFGSDDEGPPCTQVVGIVEDHRREELVEADPHWLYFLNQSHPAFQGPPQALMAGVRGDPREVAGSLQSALGATSGLIRFVSARPLQANVDPQLRSWALGASMFSGFGILALVVAAWGLYSVLAFEVGLRRRELGVRAALGAGAPRLVRLILVRAVGLVGVGIALGLAASAAVARWVGALLFEVSPWDTGVYAAVAGTLLAVSVVAGVLPALRATRADPREALNAE
jgi:predicted permease